MTHDEIDTMAAGLEMDVAVARAMGCDVRPTPQGWSPRGFYCACDHPNFEQPPHGVEPDWDCDPYLKHYSTDIAAAWDVVKWLLANGHHLEIEDGWSCVILTANICGTGETAPEAICRAALEVVADA